MHGFLFQVRFQMVLMIDQCETQKIAEGMNYITIYDLLACPTPMRVEWTTRRFLSLPVDCLPRSKLEYVNFCRKVRSIQQLPLNSWAADRLGMSRVPRGPWKVTPLLRLVLMLQHREMVMLKMSWINCCEMPNAKSWKLGWTRTMLGSKWFNTMLSKL